MKGRVVMGRMLVCAACSAFALSLAPLAGATAPVREFVPASDFTISGSCSFDVAVHVVANKEYALTFSNGATLITGALKATLTNASDPSKSITLNIPGPGLYTVSGDGTLTIDARGPWLFFYPGTLVYTAGHVTFTAGAAGFSLEQLGGTSSNLCSVLA
jgi:hypothetical protein